jgi:hypothetical protein
MQCRPFLLIEYLPVHFGLSGHERVDKAEILWPRGNMEVLTNLTADGFYTVREGQGVVSSQLPNPPKTK